MGDGWVNERGKIGSKIVERMIRERKWMNEDTRRKKNPATTTLNEDSIKKSHLRDMNHVVRRNNDSDLTFGVCRIPIMNQSPDDKKILRSNAKMSNTWITFTNATKMPATVSQNFCLISIRNTIDVLEKLPQLKIERSDASLNCFLSHSVFHFHFVSEWTTENGTRKV